MEIERLDLPASGYNPELPESHRVPIAYAALSANSRVIEATNRELTRISREYARIHKILIETRADCPPAEEAVISPVQNEPNGPEPESVTPRPAAPAGTPVRNEPNAALAGCAILLARKPEPAEPAPPLVQRAA